MEYFYISFHGWHADELVERICRGEVPDSKTQACVLRAAFAKMKEKTEE